MEALFETTVWKGSRAPNHTYLLDGTKLVAYIRAGTTEPFYFKNPIKGFDRRGRTFEKVSLKWFGGEKVKSTLIEVKGSKGNTYSVDPDAKTCTCPGFTFRSNCKHLAVLNT